MTMAQRIREHLRDQESGVGGWVYSYPHQIADAIGEDRSRVSAAVADLARRGYIEQLKRRGKVYAMRLTEEEPRPVCVSCRFFRVNTSGEVCGLCRQASSEELTIRGWRAMVIPRQEGWAIRSSVLAGIEVTAPSLDEAWVKWAEAVEEAVLEAREAAMRMEEQVAAYRWPQATRTEEM